MTEMTNKAQLIEQIAKTADLTKRDAENALNATIEAISESLAAGNGVQLVGFGTFKVKQRAARQGRNPKTGETINIPASKSVGFSNGSKLHAAVNVAKKKSKKK